MLAKRHLIRRCISRPRSTKEDEPFIRVDPSYRYILLLSAVFAGRPGGGGGGVGDAGTASLVCLLDHVFLFVILAQSKDA
jgi:hypothetical protein